MKKIDVNRLGIRLARLRQLSGLSISSLATRAGIAKSYLARLERGEVENPGLQTLDSVAKALDVTLADLLSPIESGRGAEAREILAGYNDILQNLEPSLRKFIEEKQLPANDVRMLAMIEFRGKRPNSKEDWDFIYSAIKKSVK